MKITNWGNFPVIDADVFDCSTVNEVKTSLQKNSELIARGLGRSYGDSSLNSTILSMVGMHRILHFDAENGDLTCESGVSLNDILKYCVPKGWFLPVTPGTKYVTVGGAVAADVHGKNHHNAGSFSEHVRSLDIIVATGEMFHCSRSEHADLFWATCGGMGLTGIIVQATIHLIRIETTKIRRQQHKAANLDEIMKLFESSGEWTYSVAWIDCLAKGSKLGRSIFMCGEHALRTEVHENTQSVRRVPSRHQFGMPFFLPEFVLTSRSVKLFNELYYRFNARPVYRSFVEYEKFFYPLDSIRSWNKMYGYRGFTQYQFLLPKDSSKTGLQLILQKIAESGEGSFLAVLKLLGKQSSPMGFAKEGYTLALDFALTKNIRSLFTELDAIVTDHGGRFYLAKDVRLNGKTFQSGYPELENFLVIKRKFDPNNKFRSLQSKRLGLE